MTALRRAAAGALLGVLLLPGWPWAQPPGSGVGPPALRLSAPADGRTMTVGPDRLAMLGREMVRVAVPWTHGAVLYEGVSLRRLLAHFAARGSELEVVDGRGHSIGVAIDDALARGAFVVERRAGESAALGKRGPFWLVFSDDADGAPGFGPRAFAGLVELRVH